MSEWEECKLGELIDVKHGFAFKGEFFQTEPNENILITPGNFKIGGGWKEDKCKYYNGKIPEDYILKAGDLIVTMTDLSKEVDTLGYSAIVPSDPNRTFLHNQRIGLIIQLNSDADLSFLNWLMRTPEYRFHVVSSASGSTVGHTSPSRIKEYVFNLPPLPEQLAIASVLSCLDDKIDLLHRQNKTLEAMAETLFRQWFVEEAEEGWEERCLGDVASFHNGKKRPDDIIEGNIPIYGGNGILGYADKSNYEGVTVIIGRVGAYCGSLYIERNPVWISDNALVAKPINKEHSSFLFFLLKSLQLNEMAEGSSHPLLTQTLLKSIQIILPPEHLIEPFVYQADTWLNKFDKNNKQIRILEKLRDTLLPKLMSGEVRVEMEASS
ncbi:MAG: restriction endonuclease subunit S [Halobacteriota archaeon]